MMTFLKFATFTLAAFAAVGAFIAGDYAACFFCVTIAASTL